jgi:hypothetical protein
VHGMASKEPLSSYFRLDDICALTDAVNSTYRPRYYPGSLRVIHTDLSINHDAVGIASVCFGPPQVKAQGTQNRLVRLPEYTVWVDWAVRITAPPGSRIDFSALRAFYMWMNQTAGFSIGVLSWDGFESEDMTQIMSKRGYTAVKTSVDRTLPPYSTLRDVVNAQRLSMPLHTYLITELKNVANAPRKKSGTEKVDHPKTMKHGGALVRGSKDVADALCGSTFRLITDLAAIGVSSDPSKIGPPMPDPDPAQSMTAGLLSPRRSLRDYVLGRKDGGKYGPRQ